MRELLPYKSRAVVAVMLILALGIVVVFAAPQAQAAPTGFPMHSWGNNSQGQLGLGDSGAGTQRDTPTRIGTGRNWVATATAGGASLAVNSQGYLYGWGHNWTAANMGQGDNPNPGTGFITVPTRIGTASNWVNVGARGNVVASSAAVNSQGHLYTWGSNNDGQLGQGNIGATYNRNVPTRVGDRSDWKEVVIGGFNGNFMLALTTSGYLYVWGTQAHVTPGQTLEPTRLGNENNWDFVSAGTDFAVAVNTSGEVFTWGSNADGQLGRSVDAANPQNEPRPVEVLAGTPNNWTDARVAGSGVTGQTVGAINSSGHLYTWGSVTVGQLGRTPTVENPSDRPGRVGDEDNWATISGGNSHFLAFNTDNELWSWGNNADGQLGIGSIGGYEDSPQYVLTSERFSGAARGGGTHSIMLMRLDSEEVYLSKTLQLNEGTIIPDPALSFTFNFQAVEVPEISSRPAAQVPPITNQVITIDPTTASTAGGIIRVTGELNLWTLIVNALDTANITTGGLFVWNVHEVANSSNVNASPDPNTMTYDTSRFQIRAHTNRYGDLVALELLRMEEVEPGEWVAVLPKIDDGEINFLNTYTRMVGCEEQAALYISKEVVGEMANLTTPFSFTLTLTKPALTPPDIGSAVAGTVTAEVVNATTGIPVVPARTYQIAAGTNLPFTLLHNEKLRIPQLPAGTRFSVTEAAQAQFRPEATVAGIPVAPATGTYPQLAVNTALATETYIIHQTELNRASFINEHYWEIPTGLLITSTPWIAALAATLLLALLAAKRNRKRIEQIPIAY